jgi:hypothetical protein
MITSTQAEKVTKSGWAFAILGIALLTVNMLLLQENKQLKAMTARTNPSLEIQLGKMMPPLQGVDVNGKQIVFQYGQDSRKTLLLVFSPTCQPCSENMANWKSLIRDVDPNSFRLIGVSLKSKDTAEYLIKNNLSSLPVIADVDPPIDPAVYPGRRQRQGRKSLDRGAAGKRDDGDQTAP